MADDELEHEGQEVNDFEGFVEKFKNSNLNKFTTKIIKTKNVVVYTTTFLV